MECLFSSLLAGSKEEQSRQEGRGEYKGGGGKRVVKVVRLIKASPANVAPTTGVRETTASINGSA